MAELRTKEARSIGGLKEARGLVSEETPELDETSKLTTDAPQDYFGALSGGRTLSLSPDFGIKRDIDTGYSAEDLAKAARTAAAQNIQAEKEQVIQQSKDVASPTTGVVMGLLLSALGSLFSDPYGIVPAVAGTVGSVAGSYGIGPEIGEAAGEDIVKKAYAGVTPSKEPAVQRAEEQAEQVEEAVGYAEAMAPVKAATTIQKSLRPRGQREVTGKSLYSSFIPEEGLGIKRHG